MSPLTSSWDTGACVGAGTADTGVDDDNTKETEPTKQVERDNCVVIKFLKQKSKSVCADYFFGEETFLQTVHPTFHRKIYLPSWTTITCKTFKLNLRLYRK